MIEILVAFVGAVGLVAAALANRGRQHAKAAREQVQNAHSTNMREEMDERHAQNTAKLDALVGWQSDHQAKADRALVRLTRVEAALVPMIGAALVAGTLRLTQRKGKR